MAGNGEQAPPKEREIPVFTVLKNNCILKNIFLLDSPPDPLSSANGNCDREEVLTVGRHPDCNIKLEHPSISRFHLRIHSKPSSRSLCVSDLSSVHGTWVSGKRIEPGVLVKLNEGNTLRLGASSRLYKLNWVPFSFAYDVDNPFVPILGADGGIVAEETDSATSQDENVVSETNDKMLSLSDNMEGLELLFSDENLGFSIQDKSPTKLDTSPNFLDSSSITEEVVNTGLSTMCKPETGISNSVVSDLGHGSPLIMSHEVFQVLVHSSSNVEEVANAASPRACKLEYGILSSGQCGFDKENSTRCSHSPLPVSQKVSQDLVDSPLKMEDVANTDSSLTCNLESGISTSVSSGFEEENQTPRSCSHLIVSQKASQDLVDSPLNIEEVATTDSSLACNLESGISTSVSCGFEEENHTPRSCSHLVASRKVSQELVDSPLNIEEAANTDSSFMCNLGSGISTSVSCGFKEENHMPRSCSHLIVSQKASQDLVDLPSDTEEVANTGSSLICNLEYGISRGGLCSFGTENSTPCGNSPLTASQEVSQDWVDSPLNIEEVANTDSSIVCNLEESGISSSVWCGFDKENHTPCAFSHLVVSHQVSQHGSIETFEMGSGNGSGISIWLRRGKPESVHIETSQSRRTCPSTESLFDEHNKSELVHEAELAIPCNNNEQIFTKGQENASPHLLVASMKSLGEDTLEEEIFTPDKENKTPNSHLLRSMKNIEKSEVKPAAYRPSPLKRANNSNSHPKDTMHKENQHRSVLQERKSTNSFSRGHYSLKKQPALLKTKAARDPFRPLPVSLANNQSTFSRTPVCELNMDGNGFISYPEEITQSHNLQCKTMKVNNSRWIIVVDTACLLNKQWRKELQLLRGLRGTTLVIPRIVVRELDCMLRHGSFLRRTTEVSAALQWIEESMVIAKWWIHVQSSAEERSLVPPTPPAAASCWFGEEKGNGTFPANSSSPFSPYNLQEIVTPTAADHILECALLFKRIRNDGQLVLLTDEVALKIKAMAEGVLCETAAEFRRSLVNPFSTRFLYAESSPVGPSWSCADDVVLKEKYYPSPSKKLSKLGDSAKGLKLILLHNTSFQADHHSRQLYSAVKTA